MNAIQPPMPSSPGHRARRRIAAWLAVAVAITLTQMLPSAARADDEVCFLDSAGNVSCPSDPPPVEEPVDEPATGGTGSGAPLDAANLVSPRAYGQMSPEQAAAMRRLEERAVQATLLMHDLPPSEANAVRSWARGDAQNQLVVLVVEAIRTADSERTRDQRLIAGWMSEYSTERARQGLREAGAEYARWSGRNVGYYWQLVNSGASRATIEQYLSRPVRPYDQLTAATSTGGYCKYVSPAPYTTEYAGRTWQTCFTPCSSMLGCGEPTPNLEQFVRWGQARVPDPGFGSTEHVFAASSLAAGQAYLGVLAGGGAAGAAAGTALAVLGPLSGALDALVSNVLAYTGIVMAEHMTIFTQLAASFGVKGTLVSPTVMPALNLLKNPLIPMLQRLGSTAVGFSVAVIIFAITTAVMEGIKVFDALALPGKIAGLVASAATVEVAPETLLQTDEGRHLLFNQVVDATLPMPRLGAPCELYCLNAPPVVAARPTDPYFLVSAPYVAGQGLPRKATSIDLRITGAEGWGRSDVRVSETWFVSDVAGTAGYTAQSLRMGIIDWSGRPASVWLVRTPEGKYQIYRVQGGDGVHLNPSTCFADRVCTLSSSFQYLDANGVRKLASVEAYAPATGAPTFLPQAPLPGAPVTFDARDFEPGNESGGVTYRWRFQTGGSTSNPEYGEPVTGLTTTHAWASPGSYSVELTATDAAGRSATTTVVVTVAERLTVFPDCEAGGTQCFSRSAEVGQPMTLEGQVTGQTTGVDVMVDWGDGSRDGAPHEPGRTAASGGPVRFTDLDPTTFRVTASHTYQSAGTFTGTVTLRTPFYSSVEHFTMTVT